MHKRMPYVGTMSLSPSESDLVPDTKPFVCFKNKFTRGVACMKFSSKGEFRENRLNVASTLCKVLNECWEKFATAYLFMDQILFFPTCIFLA
jgi:hypothetical protein